jgi:alcohol dehydrogenase
MKAWQLDRLGGTLSFKNIPMPEPRPGTVLVKIETSSLMSYMKDYVEGKLPIYNPPKGAFTPGGNGVGVIHAIYYMVGNSLFSLWSRFVSLLQYAKILR